jgi:hypothetical protein
MQITHEQETKQASDESKNVKRNHVAVKVWSEPLQAHIWVVADEEDIKVFTAHGPSGEFITADEIQNRNCIDKDSMKAIRKILFDN